MIVFATSAEFPTLAADDRPLLETLADRGIESRVGVWSDPAHWIEPFDTLVVRSCWDYVGRLDEFMIWLRSIEARNIAVHNPVPVLEWSSRKRYLFDLEAAGIRIVPTRLLESLRDLEKRLPDWSDVVLKPELSNNAQGTRRTTVPLPATETERLVAELESGRRILIQPFVAEIATIGEASLMYFTGRFSHAVLKRPRSSDYRVQEEFGGTSAWFQPGPDLVRFGGRVLAAAAAVTGVPVEAMTYARVDLLPTDPPTLMELELFEPSLFLRHDPRAAGRLVDALFARSFDRPPPISSEPG